MGKIEIFGYERVRLSFLDSIRGIAALIVVTSHLHLMADQQTWFFDLWILRGFKASVFAVSMFFVLSGLVLYLQIEGRKINYFSFVIRRVFRIFPACVAAVTTSFLIYLWWSPSLTAIPLLNETTWPPGISFNGYVNHLWLGGNTELLRPIWSLIIEWRVSLIFPGLIVLFAWSPVFTGIVATIIAFTVIYRPELQGSYAGAIMVAFYSCLFVIGIFIAAYRFRIILFLRSRPWLRGALIVICGYYIWFRSESAIPSGYLLQGLISGVLIIVCMSTSQARRLLRLNILQHLGKISYSLYLVHMIWIGILFRILDGINPLIICVAVIASSIISADFVTKFIEVPANRFGRRIASMVKWSEIPKPPKVQIIRKI